METRLTWKTEPMQIFKKGLSVRCVYSFKILQCEQWLNSIGLQNHVTRGKG